MLETETRWIEISCVDELVRYAREFRKDEGHWIFRGLRSHTYELLPGIGRDGARKEFNGDFGLYDEYEEQKLLTHFVRRAAPYVVSRPTSTLQWLAFAQHHGLYTRLLDWTESLLVAAYFAVEVGTIQELYENDKEEPIRLFPTIYAVRDIPVVTDADTSEVSLSSMRDWPDVMLYYPPHISPRIPAQMSVFTVHRRPQRALQHPHLRAFRITANPLTMKHDLNALGVNRASLFPDVDGLAAHASWLYKWGALTG